MKNEEFRLKFSVSQVTKEENRKSELIEFIMLPYKRKLTRDEQERYLTLDRNQIPKGMVSIIYDFTREYLEMGKVESEIFSKYIHTEPKVIRLKEIPEKWTKNPAEWEK